MAPQMPLRSHDDPLALLPDWACPVALTPLEQALDTSVFRSGLSRAEWLKRLATDLQKPQLLPLLWLLPRGWKLAPAQLPPKLQTLAGVVERGLLTPALLAALADDLPHLLPPPGEQQSDALSLWRSTGQALPQDLASLLTLGKEEALAGAAPSKRSLAISGGLQWHNEGLAFEQSEPERRRNSMVARVLNRLGANLLAQTPWSIDGCSSTADWLSQLMQRGWQARGQLRSSIASFGLGASLPLETGGWSQVPLGLPIRTGLLSSDGQEEQALLPHSCLELELTQGDVLIRLQYYQGTEGLCGWEGLNDLQRPWQNDRQNGTVRYLGEPWQGDRLLHAMRLCDLMALIHNLEASERRLVHGGYGSLGFCIDSSALLQQAMEGRCQLFPVLLGGIWRERLMRRSRGLQGVDAKVLDCYQQALLALPHDGNLQGVEALMAKQRLLACQPSSSPFALVKRLKVAIP
jgi:hypothetical protein